MKSYHDIVGDGGSDVLGQVQEQKDRVAGALARVRFRVAVASGKGGVGKSTITRQIASVLASRGLSVAILDADFNGPTQARMSGVAGAVPVPGVDGVELPRARDGVRVFSVGALVPEGDALDFDSVATGESHVWRATREFASLSEVLSSTAWGVLDVLLFDLPPGAERTVQYAEFLGPATRFVMVTIPSEVSRGVVRRSLAALAKTGSPAFGYVENMSGYLCPDCNSVKPLFPETDETPFDVPCLGRLPFDPALAAACDLGTPWREIHPSATTRALGALATRLLESLETVR